MNYCGLKECDIANGIGVRVTLFVSGCTNRCKNCFQPETWDFNYGEPFVKEVEDKIIARLRSDYITGLTVLGGEPFEPSNQRALLPFLRRVRRETGKSIWAFSGFTLDREITVRGAYPNCEVTEELLALIDVLVDGRYIDELKDITLRYRGSTNQRIIDMNKTREKGELTLWDEKQAVS